MLYSEIIAVFSEIHTKHINTLCGQNVELLIVKPGGTHSNHWAWEGSNIILGNLNLKELEFDSFNLKHTP
jgi:hypothetical protein